MKIAVHGDLTNETWKGGRDIIMTLENRRNKMRKKTEYLTYHEICNCESEKAAIDWEFTFADDGH